MIEMLENVFLFGLVENVILLLFFEVVMKNEKLMWWHVIPSTIVCMISYYAPFPYSKQIIGFLFFTLYLIIIGNGIKKSLLSVLYGFLYLLCIEMVICFVLNVFSILDLTTVQGIFEKFIFMLPIRAVEFSTILIIYIKRRTEMGFWWLGQLEEIEDEKEEVEEAEE